MRFIHVGDKTINIEAIDAIHASTRESCFVHLRGGDKIGAGVSREAFVESITKPGEVFGQIPSSPGLNINPNLFKA